MSELLDRARAWAAEDPDPRTRRELEDLVAQAGAETGRQHHRLRPAPRWPTPSTGGWSSAPPGCAVRSAPARTG